MREIEKQIIEVMSDYASEHELHLMTESLPAKGYFVARCDGPSNLGGEIQLRNGSNPTFFNFISDSFREYVTQRGIVVK